MGARDDWLSPDFQLHEGVDLDMANQDWWELLMEDVRLAAFGIQQKFL